MSRTSDNDRNDDLAAYAGEQLDAVSFEELGSGTHLHVCRACGSALVYPIDWDEMGHSHWEVTLRCPECERVRTGIFDQTAVERFDAELDRSTTSLVDDLRTIVRANMEHELRALRRRADGRCDPPGGLRAGLAFRRPSGVAVDHAVGDELEGAAFGVLEATRQLLLGRGHELERPTAASSSAPVAAIASQIRSASAGEAIARGSSAASWGSRSRARTNGRVIVPSSRSVPRCLPVASTGPLTSSTSSRIWKARPMRRPNAASTGARPLASSPSSQAAANRRAVFSSQRSR